MNETTLSIGDNFNSPSYTISTLSDINWLFEYSGSWIKICPGFFEYGQNESPKSLNKATSRKPTQTTKPATKATTKKPTTKATTKPTTRSTATSTKKPIG